MSSWCHTVWYILVLPRSRISLIWCTICKYLRFANHDLWSSRAICELFIGLSGSWFFHYYPNHDLNHSILWTDLSIYLLYQFYLFIILIVVYLIIPYIQLSSFKSPTLPGIKSGSWIESQEFKHHGKRLYSEINNLSYIVLSIILRNHQSQAMWDFWNF